MATKDKRLFIDKLSRTSGQNTFKDAISNMFGGIDARGMGSPYQKNTDSMGLVFFTRPDLNLSYDNITNHRALAPMARLNDSTGDERVDSNMHRAMKLMLSPRLCFGKRPNRTDLINVNSPFMDVAGNLLQSLNGWNDIALDTYTAPEGLRKESWSMMDSVAENNGVFSLTASFNNVEGDPMTTIFHYWSVYMSLVYTGEITPWPDNVITNTKDYETRIWRLVLDKTQTYVRKIASCVAYPKATPIALNLNYNRENKFATDNDQISLPFECQAAEYNDPILYEEFNLTVEHFNPYMKKENRISPNGPLEGMMVKLDSNEVPYFNFEAVPYIDTLTLELQWWVPQDSYKAMVNLMEEEKNLKLNSDLGFLGTIINNEQHQQVSNKTTAEPKQSSSSILDEALKGNLPNSPV